MRCLSCRRRSFIRKKELLLSNYEVDGNEAVERMALMPFEARVYLLT